MISWTLSSRERKSHWQHNECVWIILFDCPSSVSSDFPFLCVPSSHHTILLWRCSRSDRSIYLVPPATKLHNHFTNYFLSTDYAENHQGQSATFHHAEPIPSIPHRVASLRSSVSVSRSPGPPDFHPLSSSAWASTIALQPALYEPCQPSCSSKLTYQTKREHTMSFLGMSCLIMIIPLLLRCLLASTHRCNTVVVGR